MFQREINIHVAKVIIVKELFKEYGINFIKNQLLMDFYKRL